MIPVRLRGEFLPLRNAERVAAAEIPQRFVVVEVRVARECDVVGHHGPGDAAVAIDCDVALRGVNDAAEHAVACDLDVLRSRRARAPDLKIHWLARLAILQLAVAIAVDAVRRAASSDLDVAIAINDERCTRIYLNLAAATADIDRAAAGGRCELQYDFAGALDGLVGDID